MSTPLENLVQRLQENDMNASGEKMVESRDQIICITVREILAAVGHNPNHPIAAILKSSVAGMGDDYKVNCAVVDIQALIDNRTVEVEISRTKDNREVRQKKLGNKIDPSRPPIAEAATDDADEYDTNLDTLESAPKLPQTG